MLSALILMSTIAASPLNGAPVALPFTAEEATASVGDMVAAEAHTKAVTPRVKPVAEEEVGFIDKYYPFVLADNLHPEIEDNLVVVWLLSALLWEFAGALWIPKAMVGLDVDDEFMSEALVGWLIHLVPLALTFTGILSWLGAIYWIAASAYLSPVHIINTYNRHIVGGGKKKSGDGESKKSADLKGVLGMPEVAAAAF